MCSLCVSLCVLLSVFPTTKGNSPSWRNSEESLRFSEIVRFSEQRVAYIDLERCSLHVHSLNDVEYYIPIDEAHCVSKLKLSAPKLLISDDCALICSANHPCDRYSINRDQTSIIDHNSLCPTDISLILPDTSFVALKGDLLLIAGQLTKHSLPKIHSVHLRNGSVRKFGGCSDCHFLSVSITEENFVVAVHSEQSGNSITASTVVSPISIGLNTILLKQSLHCTFNESAHSSIFSKNLVLIRFPSGFCVWRMDENHVFQLIIERKLEKRIDDLLLHKNHLTWSDRNEFRIFSISRQCVVHREIVSQHSTVRNIFWNETSFVSFLHNGTYRIHHFSSSFCISEEDLLFTPWRTVKDNRYQCTTRVEYGSLDVQITNCTKLRRAKGAFRSYATVSSPYRTSSLPEFFFGTWSEWSQWEKCDCTKGIRRRTRYCMGEACEGCPIDISSCSSECVPSRRWTNWTRWIQLNESTQYRSRASCESHHHCSVDIKEQFRNQTMRDKASLLSSNWSPWRHFNGVWVRYKLTNNNVELAAYPARVYMAPSHTLLLSIALSSFMMGTSTIFCVQLCQSMKENQKKKRKLVMI